MKAALIPIAVGFYFLAVFQTAFLSHYLLLGVTPNLVFILFFLLVFFEKQENFLLLLAYVFIAGVLQDIFSISAIGWSPLFLLGIAWSSKKIQGMLKEPEEKHPLPHFIMLFSGGLLAYQILGSAVLYGGDLELLAAQAVSWQTLVLIGYTTAVAVAGFYGIKKIQSKKIWR